MWFVKKECILGNWSLMVEGAPWDTFVPPITFIHPQKLSNHFPFNLRSIETKCVMIVI